jgi:hypothetical protein
MLPINLLNALEQYTLGQKPPQPTTAADTQPQAAPQLEVGQKVQGTIQAQVAPNVYKVNVAGQTIQMQLPAMLQSGDTVPLQVVSLLPRLAFTMAASSTPIATPDQLGSAAKTLSALSQQPPEKAFVRATEAAPLWETPQPPQAKQLAGMLSAALGSSGLFYESHQAQWLEGQRSTAQLLIEPQNLPPEQARAAAGTAADRLAISAFGADKQAMMEDAGKLTTIPDTPPLTASAQTQTAPAAQQANNPATPQEASNPATPNMASKPATLPPDAGATPSRIADAGTPAQSVTASGPSLDKPLTIPGHLQPLVQQQLNALETSQMLWQGPVWPGQQMQWEIHEQVPKNPAEMGQRLWVTQVRLNLPNLGEVAATLRLNSAGLGLTLNADNPQTRATLGSASTQLVSALSNAGIAVVSTQVTE